MFELYSDEYFMQKALNEAQIALEKGEVPVGAVVVSNNRIIGKAHNLTETLTDVTAHAELQAITSAANYLGGKYLKNCTLYVTLEPCVMCAGGLFWSQIDRVVYGTSDLHRGFLKYQIQLHSKTKVSSGVLAVECKTMLDVFFQSKRN